MVQHICPRCNQRFIVSPDCDDFVHECNSGNLTLDQEDVVVSGDWEDYTGSGTISAQMVNMQGSENELFGTRAAIEGENEEEKTRRGLRASTRRQRQHLEFINLGNKS